VGEEVRLQTTRVSRIRSSHEGSQTEQNKNTALLINTCAKKQENGNHLTPSQRNGKHIAYKKMLTIHGKQSGENEEDATFFFSFLCPVERFFIKFHFLRSK
jgi:hypothetical protein